MREMPNMTQTTHPSQDRGQVASSRQCVFRCDQSWYSVPATSLRSVTIGSRSFRPPTSPGWLDGIVHLQSEFIPVISLNAYLDRQSSGSEGTAGRLLIVNVSPTWAIRADEVAALTDIEASLSPGYQVNSGRHSGVVGTFTWAGNVARVLEPHNLLTQIQRALHDFWNQPSVASNHRTNLGGSLLAEGVA